jgi:hypothetical protein
VIGTVDGDAATVHLAESVEVIPLAWLQNFSAAARKAWRTMPDRRAGRPRDPSLPQKRMVSLRLEAALWEELGRAVEAGLIRSREAAVNEWLRERLDQVWGRRDADTFTKCHGA